MKKLFVFLVLAFALFTLAGCRNNVDDNRPTLTVGLECNYPPFNWTTMGANEFTVKIDNFPGYADGYDVVVAKRIADALGYRLVIKKLPWEGLISALKSGMIDAIIAGMSPTAERKLEIDFTAPYYISEQSIVVKANSSFANATKLADFRGAKMLAQMGTLQVDLIEQIPEVNALAPLNSYPELLISLSSGVADGVVCETPVAESFIKGRNDLKIVSFTEGNGFAVTEEDVAVAIGLRKESDALITSINSVLNGLSVEARNEIMTAALNRKAALDEE
jgi:ABC-type amino acid transport substrate-binding protein